MGLERWPHIEAAIKGAGPCQSVALPNTAQRTLKINGRSLTSGFDRTGEAAMAAYAVPVEATEAWVYGVALGDTIINLLARKLPGADACTVRKLHVVIMSLSVTKASFEFNPPTWLDSERVELHLASEFVDVVRGPFAVSPLELQECDPEAEPLRDRLRILLDAEFQAVHAASHVVEELRQYEENKPYIEYDGPVTKLFGPTGRNLHAIVCVGGPSLADYYGWIRDRAGISHIICASTVLKPLLAANITPDYVLCVDPAPLGIKHFDNIDPALLRHTVLVYAPTVYPPIVRLWPGVRRCARVEVGNPESDLYSAGTVLHAAADLAVRMGSPEVTLIGADMSYAGAASHVAGAPLPVEVSGERQAWREHTLNGRGERVMLDTAMMMFRRGLEDYIAEHPEVRWYKLGRAGVPVVGATWLD